MESVLVRFVTNVRQDISTASCKKQTRLVVKKMANIAAGHF
jgi:hypothetical protein